MAECNQGRQGWKIESRLTVTLFTHSLVAEVEISIKGEKNMHRRILRIQRFLSSLPKAHFRSLSGKLNKIYPLTFKQITFLFNSIDR
jgi:hypothetical protein